MTGGKEISLQDRFTTVAPVGIPATLTDHSWDSSGFGAAVFDDPSLESSLEALNENLLLRGGELFITVANTISNSEPAVTEGDFDYVAT